MIYTISSKKTERCQSGLMCTLGKRVYGNVPEVQILSSPPANENPTHKCGVFALLSNLWRGFELGASKLVCVFAVRRKNSPVDCFAGGSREANPLLSAKKRKSAERYPFFF